MKSISIIGLGYVGLPLAVAFSKKTNVVGFDINKTRVINLNLFKDETGEIDSNKLEECIKSKNLKITDDIDQINNRKYKIITVPTPVNEYNIPDLKPQMPQK